MWHKGIVSSVVALGVAGAVLALSVGSSSVMNVNSGWAMSFFGIVGFSLGAMLAFEEAIMQRFRNLMVRTYG